MLALILALAVTGAATAATATVILSNVLSYRAPVSAHLKITAPWLGSGGTVYFFLGQPKNVSVSVNPVGFVGVAAVEYRVNATRITCGNVTLTPIPGYDDSATCAGGVNGVRFQTEPKSFDGSAIESWYLQMTFSASFNTSIQIYAVPA